WVYRAERADRIKLIFWAATDLCLFAKRLEQGAFLPRSRTACFVYPRRSCQPCSKGLIRGVSMRCDRL
ncbi:MAG: IS66 family insertion sequence element accessory protein TnpB, partial [Bryobacteraceae bacterium]